MLYAIAHFLRDKLPFIWDLVDILNSWLFGIRFGKKLRAVEADVLSKYEAETGMKVVPMAEVDTLVLVDFFATWCGPCRMIAPSVEQLAAEFEGRAVVGKVDVDQEPALAQRFGVMSIPTLVVLKGGKVVEQAVGARGKQDIAAMIERHL